MQWPIFPALHFGTVREFFHAAESVRDQLPVIAHEVNYFAPGCYTTQSRIKQGNRRLEAQLCDTEVLERCRAKVDRLPAKRRRSSRSMAKGAVHPFP